MVSSVGRQVELACGSRLDRYELVCPIAHGGMATVWLAKLRGRHGFEKLVALKTILPEFAQDHRFRRMFLDEAKTASRIEHPNVAQILDLGEHAGQLYLVMEWFDGDSLQTLDRIAAQSAQELPVRVVARLLADACAGLHAAHELKDGAQRYLNVVHRDVSPQNILVSESGVVKVIDFGLVKSYCRNAEETATGVVKGKLGYMAPEQALGHALDRRADVWSVGATLYRLLARRPVFRESSRLATFNRLTSASPPEPLPAKVPSTLANIVMRALEFEPARRFGSCDELRTALEAFLADPADSSQQVVAPTVSLFLGPALSSRRKAIALALQGVACPSSEEDALEPDTCVSSSRTSAARALPAASTPVRRLTPSDQVTVVEVPSRSGKPIEERPPRAMPSWPTPRRVGWLALAGIGAVLAVVLAMLPDSRDAADASLRRQPMPSAVAETPPESPGAAQTMEAVATRAEPAPAAVSVQALPVLTPNRPPFASKLASKRRPNPPPVKGPMPPPPKAKASAAIDDGF